MENKTKSKLSVKDSHFQELYENNPDSFEIITNTIKIYSQKDNFYKNMQLPIEVQKYLLDELWITYLGYLNLLLNSLTYDNTIDFRALHRLWVKQWMIDVCKKKLIRKGIVKKYEWDFYVNPDIAVKWEKINANIKKLFE